MARQVIDISTANSGQGTPLRTAFSMINSMTEDLYADDAGDVNSITATAPIARDSATGAVTISLTDGGISTQKIADDAVTTDKLANAINSAITANTAKVTNATHSGDVTGSAALTIASNAVTTAKILKDWSTGAVFVMSGTLTGAIEFDFTGFKTGQTIDIYNLTGAYAITFDSDAATSETFNKCGGVDYVGASTNLIQVQCVDDSANAVFNYAVSAYVSDTTPS